jgi:hypothetical protein
MDCATISVEPFGLTTREFVNIENKKSMSKLVNSANASCDSIQKLILFFLLSRGYNGLYL